MAISKGRILSLIITGIYVIYACWLGGLKGGAAAFALLLIPLAFIWLGDDTEVSKYNLDGHSSGWDFTPGCFIRAIGWIFLFTPLVVWLIKVFGYR